MDYEGVNNIVCEAEENDWLDVSYAERKYVSERKPSKRKKINFNFKFKLNKKMLIVAAAIVLCAAVLATLLFVDGNFSKDVFGAVKTVFSASVFGENADKVESSKIEIPCNASLVSVENGVATFNGGKATLSFTAGKVSKVDENSVTVDLDETTSITYGGLITVMVNIGDEVAANSLLGKYDGAFTATIATNGEAVTEVMASDTQLSWNV